MTANPQTVAPTTEVGAIEQAAETETGARWLRRVALVVVAVVVLFAATYALAWFRANSLTAQFMADADRSYEAGNYLEALTGYEEFDPASNTYVTHGGYMKVAGIWADPNAQPRPASLTQAQQRIDEILNQRITISEAEGFVQANVGQQNPYLGVVYLRLGELYEQEGDLASAKQIYSDVAELFPNEEELIAKAKANLQRLETP